MQKKQVISLVLVALVVVGIAILPFVSGTLTIIGSGTAYEPTYGLAYANQFSGYNFTKANDGYNYLSQVTSILRGVGNVGIKLVVFDNSGAIVATSQEVTVNSLAEYEQELRGKKE